MVTVLRGTTPRVYFKFIVLNISQKREYPNIRFVSLSAVLGSNFDLIFKRKSIDDMVLLSDGKGLPNMESFTIAMYLRADSRYNSGTLFSYSVPQQPNQIIVLSFTESQVQLKIKDSIVSADIDLTDDQWHFLGAVWQAVTGIVSVYVDGTEITKARNVKTNDTIIGGGWLVLGQRFLAEVKMPTLSTAFAGTMHQVGFWNSPAEPIDMWIAAQNCTWPIAGSLRSWNNFLFGIKGHVEKRFMTQCKGT